MVTQSAVKVRCSQFHGCASQLHSALSPSLQCSYPCHSYAWFKISCYFFLCYHHPHYPLYISQSSFSTFTLSFGPLPELHSNFVLPSLHRGWLWQLCPFTGLSRWSAPFQRLLPDWRAQGLFLCSASPAEDLQFFGILNTTNHRPLPSQTLKTLEISFAFDEFIPVSQDT